MDDRGLGCVAGLESDPEDKLMRKLLLNQYVACLCSLLFARTAITTIAKCSKNAPFSYSVGARYHYKPTVFIEARLRETGRS